MLPRAWSDSLPLTGVLRICKQLSCVVQDAEWFEAKKSRQDRRGLGGGNGYGNGRPSRPPQARQSPAVVNELDEDETDMTDAAIEALAKGARPSKGRHGHSGTLVPRALD